MLRGPKSKKQKHIILKPEVSRRISKNDPPKGENRILEIPEGHGAEGAPLRVVLVPGQFLLIATSTSTSTSTSTRTTTTTTINNNSINHTNNHIRPGPRASSPAP